MPNLCQLICSIQTREATRTRSVRTCCRTLENVTLENENVTMCFSCNVIQILKSKRIKIKKSFCFLSRLYQTTNYGSQMLNVFILSFLSNFELEIVYSSMYWYKLKGLRKSSKKRRVSLNWLQNLSIPKDLNDRNTTRRYRKKKCIARSWSNLVNEPKEWVYQVWRSWVQYTSSFCTWVINPFITCTCRFPCIFVQFWERAIRRKIFNSAIDKWKRLISLRCVIKLFPQKKNR